MEDVKFDEHRPAVYEMNFICPSVREEEIVGSGNSDSTSVPEVLIEKPSSAETVDLSDNSNQTEHAGAASQNVYTTPVRTGSDSREFSDETLNNAENAVARNTIGGTTASGAKPEKRRYRKRTKDVASCCEGPPVVPVSSSVVHDTPITKYFRGTQRSVPSEAQSRSSSSGVRRRLQCPATETGSVSASNNYWDVDNNQSNFGKATSDRVYAPSYANSFATDIPFAHIEGGTGSQTDLTGTDIDRKDRRIMELEMDLADKNAKNTRLQSAYAELECKMERCCEMQRKMLIEQSLLERKQRRAKCMEDRLRLGQFTSQRRGASFEDVFIDGYAFVELGKKLAQLTAEREDIGRATQLLKKRKPMSSSSSKKTTSSTGTQSNANASSDGFTKPDGLAPLTLQEYYEMEEIYRLRKEKFKTEEAELLAERDRLERERNLHMRELKRIQNEDQSRHKGHATLNNRYVLLSLLGKGGFSEVWRSFDLEEQRYVACKIHAVNREWSEEKKANYVRHTIREKDIHRTLDHPRVVRLFDVFSIDLDTLVTVLEYCDGNDLDFYLKQSKFLPEKEARSIVMQVIHALKYLNELKPPIIHYDLKPANILMCTGAALGEIKLTDFGLSKIMDSDTYDPAVGMELTSQGAGTYWYLPPECFRTGAPPKICSKVDVWSIGIIFYQCLYGERPFGHNQSQTKILESGTILNATSVVFPAKPCVSAEAKDFITSCLQYSREDRADVFQLYNHEYLKPKGHKGQSTATVQSLTSQQQ